MGKQVNGELALDTVRRLKEGSHHLCYKRKTSVFLEEIGSSCPQRDAGEAAGGSPNLLHCALSALFTGRGKTDLGGDKFCCKNLLEPRIALKMAPR